MNKGVGEARNTLLDAATKEFLLFVDPDDYVDTDLVERLKDRQAEANADVVFYDYCVESQYERKYVESPEFEDTRKYLIAYLRRELLGGILGKFIKKALFNDNHIRVRCGLNYSEDFLIFAQAMYYSLKTVTLHGSFYYYNTCNNSSVTYKFKDSQVVDQFIANDILHEFYARIGGEYLEAHEYGKGNHICNLFFEAAISNSSKSFKILKRYMRNNQISPYTLWKPMMYMPCKWAYLYYHTIRVLSELKNSFKK